ncbi:hypothetical protein ACLB2K_051431 [Fragaria x ananassa]
MKGGGESRGEEAEKEENLGEKLARRRRVLIRKSSRGGPDTPVLSSWSLYPFGQEQQRQPIIKDALLTASTDHTCVSARKLGAALWEFQNYFPLSEMHRGNGVPPPPRQQLHHLHLHHHHLGKDKGTLDLSNFLADNCPSSPDQPASASSLTRHIAASLMQHHRSIGRNNNHLLQPVSPASYGSSMEVAPYNPAVTPTSSLDFKGRIGESHYNLKTSTELLKVLNRIWSLEEQHTSNIALIKALKAELDHARVKIKDLVRVRQADRHELDSLMKQIGEDKLVRKSKEQDRIHAAVQSVRDELEDERRLRKRSESLHRKLARDLSEVKSSLSNSLRELESERKSRKLLEDLCDEFAKGIKDYEQEVHFLKQKSDMDWTGSSDRDRLILHVSESWLDERLQMQLEQTECGLPERNSVVDKLSLEIETFLQAKHMNNTLKNTESLLPRDRQKNSMESFPINELVSAPQDAGDEEDSLGGDSHCFELNKPSNSDLKLQVEEAVENGIDEKVKSDHSKKKPASSDRVRSRTPSSLQVKFEEQMAWALSSSENKKSQVVNLEQGKAEVKQTEISMSKKSEHCEATEDETYKKGNKQDERHGSDPNYMAENHIRNQLLISDGGHVLPENNLNEASCSNTGWRNQASPVRQWMAKLTSPALDISDSSSKLPLRKRENTLKAKLLEARSKGQRSTRTKSFKSTS